MTNLVKIQATIVTGTAAAAGTDGDIYLGICGREFHCDTSAGDFESGTKAIYQFGAGSNVKDPSINDPNKPQLRVEDADLAPVYIRFAQGTASDWKLASVEVVLNDGPVTFSNKHMPNLWMGHQSGAFCHLRKSARG